MVGILELYAGPVMFSLMILAGHLCHQKLVDPPGGHLMLAVKVYGTFWGCHIYVDVFCPLA